MIGLYIYMIINVMEVEHTIATAIRFLTLKEGPMEPNLWTCYLLGFCKIRTTVITFNLVHTIPEISTVLVLLLILIIVHAAAHIFISYKLWHYTGRKGDVWCCTITMNVQQFNIALYVKLTASSRRSVVIRNQVSLRTGYCLTNPWSYTMLCV